MNARAALSRICFGCEPLGGMDWGEIDLPAIADAIDRALELGIDFFDTAAVYGLGLSEERLAEMLGARRHDVVIATKGGLAWARAASGGRAEVSRDSSPRHLRQGVEGSLRRLKLECLPVFYVHWPDPNTEIRRAFECLAELNAEGKIGRIGCSNFSAAQVRAASEVAEVSLAQLPLNVLGEGPDTELEAALAANGIGIVAYNVLAGGLLTGKFGAQSRFPSDDRRSRLPMFQGDAFQAALRRVADIAAQARAQGLTAAQQAIAGVLRRPGVVSAVLGIKSRAQIEENAAALSFV